MKQSGTITIVLSRPKHETNIGFVVRCAMNMDIDRLIVIPRKGGYDDEEIGRTATHFGHELVRGIEYCDDLEGALAEFQYVVGTTARCGNTNLKRDIAGPREMASTMAGLSESNDIALLFGPEDRGLTNDELRYCDLLVTIPVSERMRSINLSHAVMILCYEIFLARKGTTGRFVPKLATSREKEDMFSHLKEIFVRINFINHENPDYWMTAIRRFFSRMNLCSRDVKIIRGICRQIDLYGKGKTRPYGVHQKDQTGRADDRREDGSEMTADTRRESDGARKVRRVNT